MQRREALVHKTLILLLLAGLSWQPAAANAATRTRGGTSAASVKANRPLNFAYSAWTTVSYTGTGVGGAVKALDQITYTVHVHNTGTDPITALTIMSNVPANTSLYGAMPGYILSGTQLTYTPALPLAAGDSTFFNFSVSVNNGSLAGVGYINNNSYVDFSDGNGYQTAAYYNGGPIPTAAEYGTQVPVDNGMNAVAWKTQVYSTSGAGGYIGSGDVIHYVIWVRNIGTAALANIKVTDFVPSYTNWATTSNGSGAQPDINGMITWNIVSLAPGAQDSVSFNVTVAQDLTGATAIENTATVDIKNNKSAFSTVPVDASGNNPSAIPTVGPSTSIPVKSITSFETWKLWLNDDDNTLRTVSPGEEVTFYIYVHNTGNIAINTITVNDVIPFGMTFKSIKDGGAFNQTANTVKWSIDNVAAGAKTVVRFTVTIDTHLEGIKSITNTAKVESADTALYTIGCDPTLSTCDGKVGTVLTVAGVGKDLFISTVVTPNGDGKNDVFYVRNIEKYPNSALHIFNRWGNTVYQSKSYQNNWSASGLSEGTYYYQFDLNNQDGTIKTYKGWVMIIR